MEGVLAELRSHAGDHTPEVDETRCVHSLLEQAQCRRCVDRCPTGAWVIDDELLGIDTERCDGCGLCVPACPERAIHPPRQPDVRQWRGRRLVFAACDRIDQVDAEAQVGCLHALDLATLADWAAQGVTHLVTAAAPCNDCTRQPEERLSARLARLNRLLDDRRLPALQWRELPVPRWRAMWAGTRGARQEMALSRRGFLRRLSGQALELALEDPCEGPTQASGNPTRPVAKRLGAEGCPGTWFLYAPRIDPQRCTGCDACLRICPHEALTLDEKAPAYEMDPDACTGCGACVDVCEVHAVAVECDVEAPQWSLPLVGRRCRACGAPFHLPREGDPGTGNALCPICRQVNHPARLYQVYT